MLRPRIIPCLLLQGGGLVKTVRFREPKYVGDPINAVRIFNEKEADELIVLDIGATTGGATPNLRLIGQFATECRMPLCYGGGIKTREQAKQIIALGVEKVALSSAAIENPGLIPLIADDIGRQSVVVVLDVRRKRFGSDYEIWTHNGTTNTGKSAIEFAQQAAALGAGEIVINSIDRDGEMKGYDLEFAQNIRKALDIPMTVLGGAGSLEDIGQLVRTCGVVGAAAGSLFVFKGTYRAVLINYPKQAQREQLISANLTART